MTRFWNAIASDRCPTSPIAWLMRWIGGISGGVARTSLIRRNLPYLVMSLSRQTDAVNLHISKTKHYDNKRKYFSWYTRQIDTHEATNGEACYYRHCHLKVLAGCCQCPIQLITLKNMVMTRPTLLLMALISPNL